MEIENRQAEFVEQFVTLAKSARGRAAAELISHATSHPSLFAFAELLSMPHISELQNTEYGNSLDLLKLFAYGTWSDYKNNLASFPQLETQQKLKLKQLTVLTLAESSKLLPYELLMRELDISNVRDLEDLLINDCMYAGIVRGKLDQCRRCFEVNFAAGRDLRPGQLQNMIQTLGNWMSNSESLLETIQEKIQWADMMGEIDSKHKKEVEEKSEQARKTVRADPDIRGHQEFSYMENSGPMVVNYMEEERVRSKRYPKKRFGKI